MREPRHRTAPAVARPAAGRPVSPAAVLRRRVGARPHLQVQRGEKKNLLGHLPRLQESPHCGAQGSPPQTPRPARRPSAPPEPGPGAGVPGRSRGRRWSGQERRPPFGRWARALANISRQVALRLIVLRAFFFFCRAFFFFLWQKHNTIWRKKRNYQQRAGEINIWKLMKCNLHIQLIPSISVERIKMHISMMDIALIGT